MGVDGFFTTQTNTKRQKVHLLHLIVLFAKASFNVAHIFCLGFFLKSKT